MKKHKYPPEDMDDAVQIVMTQCELWRDNTDMGVYMTTSEDHNKHSNIYKYEENNILMAAEEKLLYGNYEKN